MKVTRLLFAGLFVLAAPMAWAGAWSKGAWTDDASTGLESGRTLWVYHFGSATEATVNGVTVTGIAVGDPSVPGRFAVSGIADVFNGDTNNLTALGGTGSAVMAADFIFGGYPGTVTVDGLTVGQTYVVSFFGVGFDVSPRISTFASGADSLAVDENLSFGDNNGLRVEYTFVATAATRVITISPQATATFQLYGLALRFPFTVTTAADEFDTPSGPDVSLREAVRDAGLLPGADTIIFAAGLTGPIALGNEIVLGSSVTIDASGLAANLTVSGGNAHRVFYVNSGQAVSLLGLNLTDGNGVGTADPGFGGAIHNQGTLKLTRCTLSGNSVSGNGGAIRNHSGTLTLTGCTLSGNSAAFGGAIYSDTNLSSLVTSLTHCTVSANTATMRGGGLYNFDGRTILSHCTISGNTAPATAGSGVASYGDHATETVVANSVISGNVNSDVDVFFQTNNSFTSSGKNLIGTGNATGDFNQAGDIIGNTDPLLAPLGHYGGPTQTRALLLGSPAHNAAPGSTATSDQRGFPIVAVPDIGAYEAGTPNNFNTWAWEIFPVTADIAQRVPGSDYESDGRLNALEYATLTDPVAATPGGLPLVTRNAAGSLAIVFPYRAAATDLLYELERSTTVGPWTKIAKVNLRTGFISSVPGVSVTPGVKEVTLTDTFISGQKHVFYRLKAIVP